MLRIATASAAPNVRSLSAPIRKRSGNARFSRHVKTVTATMSDIAVRCRSQMSQSNVALGERVTPLCMGVRSARNADENIAQRCRLIIDDAGSEVRFDRLFAQNR